MKRTLTTILVVMFAATGASAITITIDSDKSTYLVGEDIVLTLTAVADGTELAGSFSNVVVQVIWDSTVASVKNAPAGAGFGQAAQTITAGPNLGFAGLSTVTVPSGTAQNFVATATPSCANDSMTCSIISQTLGLLPVGDFFAGLDTQTLVGTLVLTLDAPAFVGLGFGAIDVLGTTTSAGFIIGTNFSTATWTPEPTTAALLGLGLVGLAVQRRVGRL